MTAKAKSDANYKLALVQWVDAESDCEWEDHEKLEAWANEECIINEVGWVVKKTVKYLVISNQVTYDGTIGNRTKIPLKWIKSVRHINEARFRQKPKDKKKRLSTRTKASSSD